MWLLYQSKINTSFKIGLTRRQVIISLLIKRRERRRKDWVVKTKIVWVEKLYRERKEKGEYSSLIKEMQIVVEMLFYQQFRMTAQRYKNLLTLVAPRITMPLVKRDAISPGEWLSVYRAFQALWESLKRLDVVSYKQR